MRTTTLLLAALTIAPAAAFAMPGYGPGHHHRVGFSGQSVALLDSGVCHRRVVRYRSGAVAARGACVRGLKEGNWQTFSRRGRLTASANFWRGQRHGLWVSYGRRGRVLARGHYRTGHRHGAWFNGAARTTVYWNMGHTVRRPRKARYHRRHRVRRNRHHVVVGGPASYRTPQGAWRTAPRRSARVQQRAPRYNRTYDARTHRVSHRNGRVAHRSARTHAGWNGAGKGHKKGRKWRNRDR